MSSARRGPAAVAIDCLIVIGVVLLVIAACLAIGGSSGAPTQSTPVSAADVSVAPTLFEASTTSNSATTSTSTTTPATTPTTTTTIAPTTTIALTVEVVADVCESLRSDGLETRRVVIDALADAFTDAGGDGDGRAEVAVECGHELDRLDGAVEIRDRMQTIATADEDELDGLSFSDFMCAGGVFEATITNDAAVPLGLHANFAMYIDGDREHALQSSLEPIVVWSIEPGASEVVSGRFAASPQSQIDCRLEAAVFGADPSSADASLGSEAEYPALTGDEPSAWFPALSEVERAARASGDIDQVTITQDVRSISYDEVAFAISEGVDLPEVGILEVCERGRSQPDDDHIGFVYHEQFASGGTRLSHGLFRRGADGQWRRLGTARYFESVLSEDCSGVNPDV